MSFLYTASVQWQSKYRISGTKVIKKCTPYFKVPFWRLRTCVYHYWNFKQNFEPHIDGWIINCNEQSLKFWKSFWPQKPLNQSNIFRCSFHTSVSRVLKISDCLLTLVLHSPLRFLSLHVPLKTPFPTTFWLLLPDFAPLLTSSHTLSLPVGLTFVIDFCSVCNRLLLFLVLGGRNYPLH